MRNIQEILYAFEGKLVCTNKIRRYICKTLSLMEDDVIDYITSNCWFFGSMSDAFAFTFTGNDLKDSHLIFLSDELFMHGKRQIVYTIAHEIGHVILGHRNSVTEKQSKAEIRKQEKEADEFAKRYVKN